MILDYEDTYSAWKESEFVRLDRQAPKTGAHVQDLCLYDTDESQLTKRERLVMIMIAISYEIEHHMLTEELTGELYFYYQDMKQGKLDKILAENEIDIVKADIEKYYKSVFSD